MEKILLVGGGGHCQVIIETIRLTGLYEIAGICDLKEGNVLGIPMIGNDDQLTEIFSSGVEHAFVSLGSIGNPQKRKSITENLLRIGYNIPNLIHPHAYLAPSVKLGKGNFIGINTIIHTAATLKDGCIINSGAIVEHDCELGDYVHIAPGAVICGGVRIGDLAHIGPNATVLQYNSIANGVIVGASSVVTKNIDSPNMIGYGNPFKKVRPSA